MNPSLPGGATSTAGELAADVWSASGRTGYTFVPYRRMQEGRDAAANPGGLAIDLHLVLAQATIAAPTGTSLDVQLPVGSLTTSMVAGERTDRGVGDLELRLRQALPRWRGIDAGVALGVVAPTGAYVARSGAANLPPEALALTLGRGATWWLAEIDARRAIAERMSAFAQLSARGPIGRTSDDFAWGPDARATVGSRIELVDRLALLVTTDVQWRGRASEPDPFAGGRAESSNVGGTQWTFSPAVDVALGGGFSLVAGARIPLAQDVVGRQLVPGIGGFAAVSFAQQLTTRRRPPVTVAAGQITVVDYWASWCAPCAEIDAALTEAKPRWPDVRVVRIDASESLPPGIDGLPVVEVFDTSGNRTLLVGEQAKRVVEIVDAMRTKKGPRS